VPSVSALEKRGGRRAKNKGKKQQPAGAGAGAGGQAEQQQGQGAKGTDVSSSVPRRS